MTFIKNCDIIDLIKGSCFNSLINIIMQKKIYLSVIMLVLLALSTTAADMPRRKIVVFEGGFSNEAAKDGLLARHAGIQIKNLDLVRGKVVYLSERATVDLAKEKGVLRIDDDVVVEALTHRGQTQQSQTQAAQSLPWGINKIDAELVWPTGNLANPVKVGIIDTGISKDHSDLKANIKGGVNTINSRKSWTDDNGHGSHVAGIVGALNNSLGVVGVAPQVDLYAIKVLGANGSGYLSDVIEGIDWAKNRNLNVINMSLGTSADVQSMHDAVIAAKAAGVTIVAAAGNSGGAVIYPAAYPEVIAVGATDANDQIAYFSSHGPEVDLAAPGVSIYSTYKGTGYKILSGTSMAAPHVTGTAALVLNTPVGANDTNANGKWDPDEVQNKLMSTATDLGAAGQDEFFGAGLVNAFAATQ